ncbi:hypothetical protein A9P82_02950 [Arachidicoccus ginsenosidimutans]|uniref:DUF4290 domain-containing protein n=1 Tax=Arachidicoccus sp. BS20 TaxID=1850526 RepID=UPI0007F05579|nr:DUF4290 domain-containing protein [Arachidicoccus sp. BS20]ANI88349.1 hypothetical protein A9P82_02950 [Arachidicoccus sp. BS20]
MEYNTQRSLLSMKEYGRHIQKMVDYLLSIEDKPKRQEQAGVLIELMGFLNPHLKNVEDFRHKLWDHLYYMSDFKLDVDSPYPIPQRETYKVKPEPLPYPKRYPEKRHLGKNIELVIDKALTETDDEKIQGFANSIAYYIKLSYNNWHKETVSDQAIQVELDSLSDGKLVFNNAPHVRREREEFKTASGRKAFVTRSKNNNTKNNGNNGKSRNGGNGNNGRNNNNFKKRY